MRLGKALLAVAAALAVGLALAGTEGSKCTMSAGDCCKKLEEKYQKQGWLGVEKEQNANGSFTITAITPGSPAESAGLKVGDVIESIDGAALKADKGARTCSLHAENAKIGDKVAYGIRRGDERLTVTAELAKIPDTILAGLMEKHKTEHETVHN